MSAVCAVCGESVPMLTSGDEPVLCAGCACPFCEQRATACVPLEQEVKRLYEQLDEACSVARDLLEKMLFWAGECGQNTPAIMRRWLQDSPWLFDAAERESEGRRAARGVRGG